MVSDDVNPHLYSAAVNLCLSRHTNTMFVRAGMLTADGRCKTLDASADGYTRQEACGAIAVSAQHLVDHGGAAATVRRCKLDPTA